MAFQQQKESILKFYESTNQILDEHRETYCKLVHKLNEKTGLTQTLNNNLDLFMEHCFPEFNKFKQDINSTSLENNIISYVFDINKGNYVSNFTLPNKKIIVKQNFKCALMSNQNKIAVLNNNNYWNGFNNQLNSTNSFLTNSFKYRSYLSDSELIMECNNNKIKKNCNCDNDRSCCGNHNVSHFIDFFRNSNIYHKKEIKNLEIWIDDYLNIYIPAIKTYLVYNYSKYPLYAFYINMDKLNLYHNHINQSIRTLIFNENCQEDNNSFSLLKTFCDFGNYLSSQDHRNKYKSLFPNLLKFYEYEDKQKFFSQYQTLSEKLDQLSPSDVLNISVDNDTMNDEKKIFTQSQRIRELEVLNKKQIEEIEYLRGERTKFIENENSSSNKLSDYQKLLEELNTQLHEEIDKTSIQQKEVIRLKNINLESSELKARYKKLEEINKSTNAKLTEKEDKLSTLKTLNNTLIDKQTESLQKITLERSKNRDNLDIIKQLKLDIEKYNVKIKELEAIIDSEKEQHLLSKSKVDELIANMSKNEINVDDQYQEILLSQLNDKNDEIKQLQKINSQLTKDIENSKKSNSLIISQISNLIQNSN